MIFKLIILIYSIIHSLKYLWSTTLGFKDIRSRKSEFVTKNQFIINKLIHTQSKGYNKRRLGSRFEFIKEGWVADPRL